MDASGGSKLIVQTLERVLEYKAWFPYSCKDRRTCLRRRFEEDFNVLSTLIADSSCERSMPMIITTI